MTFLESPRFPDKIAFGAVVGPTYSTNVVTAYSGRESRIANWSQGRIKFEVALRAQAPSDIDTVKSWFRAVKGRFNGFRIKDWTDYTATTSNGIFTFVSFGVYQLAKLYVTGALSEMRVIQKPVAGSVAVYRNGNVLSAGVSLDTTTGLATFSPFAQANVTAVTVGASTQITLASALSGLAVGGLLYLSGLGGADAGLLNGQQFTVSAIAGAMYTLSVNTSGKTITPSTGMGSMYVQPADVLTWAGQFDVPVRFDTDEMQAQIIDKGTAGLVAEWASIQMIEIRL